MSIELPPLPEFALIKLQRSTDQTTVEIDGLQEVVCTYIARERILMARIAELEAENASLRETVEWNTPPKAARGAVLGWSLRPPSRPWDKENPRG